MFIKYSTHQIPPKKSRGKGLKGKKTIEESRETVDVSEESEPELEPAKKKTANTRVVKKKVTLSADDIISDDPDVALELAKSINQTEAEEAEAARKVHATHARIVTESVSKSAKQKSSGRSSKSVVIQDTASALKSKPTTSKTKLKDTRGSHEGTGSKLWVPDESTVIYATSREGIGTKPWVLDEDKDVIEEKDEKDGDVDDEGDDHVPDKQDDDDEDDETKSDEDDIYKYKIRVNKGEDEEMKDAEVEGYDKGDEEITDASKEEIEKTSEAKDDTKKTKLPPSSSSLSVSLVQKILVSVIPETTNLPPILEIVTETLVTTADPSPQVTPIISTVQQTTTPIPTPTITTDAPTVTTIVPESNALTVVELRAAKLEKDVFELKIGDHSSVALVVLQSYVPTVVDSYLCSKHLLELTKKTTPTAEQESKKSPLEILKIKKEQAESQKNPQFTIKSTEKVALEEYDLKSGKKTKRRITKESKSSKKSSSTKETPKGKAPTKGFKTGKSASTKERVEEPIAEVIINDVGDDLVQGDRYPLDLSKPLPLQGPSGHQTVAVDYFFNIDLEYSKTFDPEVTYTISITMTKAARYEIKGIEDMVPTVWSTIKHAYNKMCQWNQALG
nr:hypothetical protein [Tanacetum cinerariifolium]